MAKPIILVVDDDAQVLRAIERDMRRHYGSTYRIVRAESAQIALETLQQLALRGEATALLLSDQRMPQMSGVEFLEAAMAIVPDAKRVLLTAYSDTNAAIQAINGAKIHYYLMKPWDPPEEKLYPIIDDLLESWEANYQAPFEGIRIIGHRWSPQCHTLRDFLARNQVPYQWLDLEENEEAQRLSEYTQESNKLPLVLFQDGSVLSAPTPVDLAIKIGFQTRAELPFYDLAIVGGGPAGLAAAVYGASEGLRTVLIEREAPGGQAGTSSMIENYLGFPQGLSGNELARRAVIQARRFGVEVLTPLEATHIQADACSRVLTLSDGTSIVSKALLIATGVSYRQLDIPGLDRLIGAGVYYGAALTEALSCRGMDVFVVGGANSAGQAAMHFSRYAKSVTMLVRGESLANSMSRYLIDQIAATPNIEVRPFTNLVEAHGENSLQAITLYDSQQDRHETIPASMLFVFIGAQPRTDWLQGVIERDPHGFVLAGPDLVQAGKLPKSFQREPFLLETSVPGVFVAGDVRSGSVKRVASGVGEGSIAIQFIHRYLATI
jgi:thioredoxin reductase (NADPH)